MRVVKVDLADRSYPILVGRNVLPELGVHCAKLKLGQRCAVICDDNVAQHYGKECLSSLTAAGFEPFLVTVKPGEPSKRLAVVEQCYDELAKHRLERKSFVVALGGGVVGDLAGFVAATYLRGVSFVQVPTTLLAQVDSSVGGKVGVNLKAGKNLVGAFYQPRLVLCDLATLDTLPPREFHAGLAEVIKYGVIYDARLFRRLERQLEQILARQEQVLRDIVARCCAIKAEVVGQDETESGVRAILNFGHTVGHALEATSGYGRLLHGEAISIGQVAAAHISATVLGFPSAEVERIRSLLARCELPTSAKLQRTTIDRLFGAMQLDKKVSGGEVKFVLARRIGVVEFGHPVPRSVVEQALSTISETSPRNT